MAQARGQWIEQQEAADAAFVQQMLAAQQAAEQKRRAEEAKARQQAWQSYRAGEREIYPAAPKTGAYKRAALAKDVPPPPEEKKCGWNPLCWIGKGIEWIGNQVKSWFQPQPPVPTPSISAIQTQAVQTVVAQFTQTAQAMPTHTPTATPASTPIPYPQYKSVGSLTEWELRVGGQVAHNAHQLLAQASQFYFWGTGAIENNQYPPLAGQNLSQPMPRLSAETHFSWPGLNGTTIPDVYEYTKGRTPFVCGDVVDWAYFMAGYNLQTAIDKGVAGGFVSQSSAYPGNRWPRSAYGYERMFQIIRLGGLEGKSEIWNVQTNGNNYSFTSENVPELGDILVTKTSSDLQDPNADHVVLVAEVHGLTPDQIIIIEGNPDDGTIVKHTLEELKNRIPGLTYIIYGHANLTPGGTP
ncbi:MAG: hypothetical protein ACOYYI_06545 [Chloroflexota bacterium]